MEIPKVHQAIMPYLMLKNAAGFIEFTKTVFNADAGMQRMRDDVDTIMHAEIMISGSTIMFCQASDQWAVANANLFIYVEDADETYSLAIVNGAATVMGLSDQDYGRTCGVTDPFGNTWWITSIKK
nr:VOC family protein [uncultured Mucilaginibacter sp.]